MPLEVGCNFTVYENKNILLVSSHYHTQTKLALFLLNILGSSWSHCQKIYRLPPGNMIVVVKMQFSIFFYWLVPSSLLVMMPLDEYHGFLLMRSVKVGSGNGLVLISNKPFLDQCWSRFMSLYGVTSRRTYTNIRGDKLALMSKWWPSAVALNQ